MDIVGSGGGRGAGDGGAKGNTVATAEEKAPAAAEEKNPAKVASAGFIRASTDERSEVLTSDLPTIDTSVPVDQAVAGQLNKLPTIRPSTSSSGDVVKFSQAEASSLLEGKKWNELLSYLGLFVDLVSHPGLVFIVVEQKTTDLMILGKFDEAKKVFDEEVKSLLAVADKTFYPLDLDGHVNGLEKHIISRKLTEGTNFSYTTNSELAMFDYMSLYAPHTRPVTEPWVGTPQEFVCPFVDNNYTRYRCRACQWVPSSGHGITHLMTHLTHPASKHHVKLCSSLTLNLLRRLQMFQKVTPELDFQELKYKVRDFKIKRKIMDGSGSRNTEKRLKALTDSDDCGTQKEQSGGTPCSGHRRLVNIDQRLLLNRPKLE